MDHGAAAALGRIEARLRVADAVPGEDHLFLEQDRIAFLIEEQQIARLQVFRADRPRRAALLIRAARHADACLLVAAQPLLGVAEIDQAVHFA